MISPRATRYLPVTVLACVLVGLVLMPVVTHAAASKHYKATFVAESALPVTGKTEIQVDANNVAHMVIHISGLLPGQTFPAHIHEGATIDNPGNILLALPDLVGNQAGVATMVIAIPNADSLDLANRTIGVHFDNGIRIAKGSIDPVGS
jgi:hypothetical protein